MKQRLLPVLAAAILFAACNNEKKDDNKISDTNATEVRDKSKADPCAGYVPDSTAQPQMDSAMMAAWMANATPGDMHKMLAKDDGEWEGEVTQWMDPAAPPQKSKSKAVNRMIMGGRYQLSEHSGCFGGMPFEGMGIVGYDNAKKAFMSTWIDNMGTTFMNLEGPWDQATKTIRLSGNCTNPMDGKQMKIREEFAYIDDNTQKLVMYGPDMTGKEFKMMEIVFIRKK